MDRSGPAQRWEPCWRLLLLGLVLALCAILPGRSVAGETGSTDEYAGVAITDSVILDPFDPVPTIQFNHGCGPECHHHWHDYGRGHCEHDCRWQGWYCPHDCYGPRLPRSEDYNVGWWRCANGCRDGDWWCDHECRLQGWYCAHECFVRPPCDHDCRPFAPRGERIGDVCADICYGQLIHEYEERLVRSDRQARRYDTQSRWYFRHVMDEHHDGDRHEGWPHGPYDPPVPPGPGPGPGDYGPPGPGGDGPPPGAGSYGTPSPFYGPPPGSAPPPPPGPPPSDGPQ